MLLFHIGPARRSMVDYILAAMAAALANYSLGLSLGKFNLALFTGIGAFASIILGGALALTVDNKKKIQRLDVLLLVVFGLVTFFNIFPLNRALPDDGFPFQLFIGAFLSWIVILVGPFCWRDQTLLFTSLPGLAAFGLVGTFDTFQPGTFLFFVFLTSIALLYSRMHYRHMLRLAERSGQSDPVLLHRDSWRWMAGTNWALASAGIVILLSLLGAPVVRQTTRAAFPNARLTLPQNENQNQQNPATNPTSGITPGDVRVGNGSLTLNFDPVFDARTNAVPYFRQNIYADYTGQGWNVDRIQRTTVIQTITAEDSLPAQRVGPNGGFFIWPEGSPPTELMANPTFQKVEIRNIRAAMPFLPTPGPIAEISGANFTVNALDNGMTSIIPLGQQRPTIEFYVSVPSLDPALSRSVYQSDSRAERFQNLNNVNARVQSWARETTRGIRNDFEKAEALRKDIAARVVYDVRAPAVPTGEDAAEYVLFESRVAYCDLFATAMVAGARSVGLTARYVTGYAPVDSEPDAEGFYTVRNADAHAWAEIYFEGVGWVIFDATVGSRQNPGGERGSAPQNQRALFDTNLIVRVGGYIILGLFLTILGTVILTRRSPEMARTAPELRPLLGEQRTFVSAIEKHTRSPKRFSQTLREYVDAHEAQLGPATEDARRIAAAFDRLLFSQNALNETDLRALAGEVRSFRQKLRAK